MRRNGKAPQANAADLLFTRRINAGSVPSSYQNDSALSVIVRKSALADAALPWSKRPRNLENSPLFNVEKGHGETFTDLTGSGVRPNLPGTL